MPAVLALCAMLLVRGLSLRGLAFGLLLRSLSLARGLPLIGLALGL